MLSQKPPTDQRSATRPISFVLQTASGVSSPLSLRIRPEDLRISDSSRTTVHQTMGREPSGWADKFGQALPSCTIAGHTGWRAPLTGGADGVQLFMQLREMVMTTYHASVQEAIDMGIDPSTVRLLFMDLLDEVNWIVEPMSFTLQRSKSRPLLMQYNISLQCLSTSIDTPASSAPFFGSVTGGLRALGGVIGKLKGMVGTIQGLVNKAVGFATGVLAPIGAAVKGFLGVANGVFQTVSGMVSAVKNGFNSVVNAAIGIASDIAKVGVNVMRTVQAITGLPSALKASLGQVAAAFNEAKCIFANALRPRETYEAYDGVYGASNCSSTTGGRPESAFTNSGPFQAIQPDRGVFGNDASALASVSAISRSDPVLAPMPLQDIGRHLDSVNRGVALP